MVHYYNIDKIISKTNLSNVEIRELSDLSIKSFIEIYGPVSNGHPLKHRYISPITIADYQNQFLVTIICTCLSGLIGLCVYRSSKIIKRKYFTKTVDELDQERLKHLYNSCVYDLCWGDCVNSNVRKEIRIIEDRLKIYGVNTKCAIYKSEMKATDKVFVCQKCIIPAIIEFHASAMFQKDKYIYFTNSNSV